MSIYIGLDIGGTKLLVAAADHNGNILRRAHEATPRELNAGLTLIKSMINRVAAGESITSIGVAIGGPMDWRLGTVSPLHQPEWRDVPLKDVLEQTFDCSVSLDVDTNVAALGEFVFGPETTSRLLYLTISTGMGGGFLIDGCVYRGMNGEHPEVGHQAIPYRCAHPERILCECGADDCLEAIVSGNGIRRIYGKPAEKLSSEEWQEVAYNLGQGLRNLATIYLPDAIVLGGGVALGGGERLLETARSIMERNLKLVPSPAIRFSRLGYDTALKGAVAIALQRM